MTDSGAKMKRNASRNLKREHYSSPQIHISEIRPTLNGKIENELPRAKKHVRQEHSGLPVDLTQILPDSSARLTQDIMALISTKKMKIIERMKSTAQHYLLPHDPHPGFVS